MSGACGGADGTARVVSQQSLKAGALVPELLQAAREAPRHPSCATISSSAPTSMRAIRSSVKRWMESCSRRVRKGPWPMAPTRICARRQHTLSLQAWPTRQRCLGRRRCQLRAQTYDRHALLDTADGRDGTMLEARYVFPEDLPLAEVRVGVSPDAAVRLDGYTLLPATRHCLWDRRWISAPMPAIVSFPVAGTVPLPKGAAFVARPPRYDCACHPSPPGCRQSFHCRRSHLASSRCWPTTPRSACFRSKQGRVNTPSTWQACPAPGSSP